MGKKTLISEVFYEEPHVLHSVLYNQVSVDEAVIHNYYQAFEACSPGKPYAVITDSTTTHMPLVSREGYAAASDLRAYPNFKAHAFVVTQTGIRLMVNFFLRTFPISIPAKIFDNVSNAKHWARYEVLKASPTFNFQVLALVTGKVQGVFYRKTCYAKATETGIKGFVKNLPDGNVQVMAQGTGKSLVSLINWCKKGPAKARVETISFVFVPVENMYSDFSVR
ncbi:MAG: acylphosphatase [Flavobacteriales bacterium]